MKLREIRSILGPAGVVDYWDRAVDPGSITDDTQMTLFTAEGLIRARQGVIDRGVVDHRAAVWSAYLRWLDTQDVTSAHPGLEHSERGFLVDAPELRRRRAPGNTCISALRSGRRGTVDNPINGSKGCGGVMRVAPVAFTHTDAFGVGADLAALTHGHPSGYLAAGALAQILERLYEGSDLAESVDEVIATLTEIDVGEEMATALKSALRVAEQGASTYNLELLGEGWLAEEALAISVYCALVAGDFRSGVLLAVNHSGDSDSTGSITGQMLGTALGVDAIPQEWVDGLKERVIIQRIADDFADCFVDQKDLSHVAYPPN